MDSWSLTPKGKWYAVIGCVAAVVGAIFLVGAIVGLWKLDWWVQGQNANAQSHIIRQGYSNQQTLREQITANLATVQGIDVQIAEVGPSDPAAIAPLQAQRHAVASIVCQDADEVTGDPLPADQASWVSANCSLGSAIN